MQSRAIELPAVVVLLRGGTVMLGGTGGEERKDGDKMGEERGEERRGEERRGEERRGEEGRGEEGEGEKSE